MSQGEFQDRIALVTGAASGLGAATAELLAREGATVVYAADVRANTLNETVDRLNQEGLPVRALLLDVSDETAWASAVDRVDEDHGRLDALVNNAGLSGADPTNEHFSTAYWNRLLSVNLTGPFFGSRASLPLLRASGSGAIVNVSSVGGVVGIKGIHPGYLASKGGLRTLTKGLAIELAQDNIRVNSVHPGAMPAMQGASWDADTPAGRESLRRNVPLGRQAEHREVAEAVAFLASARASYITGAELYADGGWLAQ